MKKGTLLAQYEAFRADYGHLTSEELYQPQAIAALTMLAGLQMDVMRALNNGHNGDSDLVKMALQVEHTLDSGDGYIIN